MTVIYGARKTSVIEPDGCNPEERAKRESDGRARYVGTFGPSRQNGPERERCDSERIMRGVEAGRKSTLMIERGCELTDEEELARDRISRLWYFQVETVSICLRARVRSVVPFSRLSN